MAVTREMILLRLEYLEGARQHLLDQANSCMGAIQENQIWLRQLEEAGKKSEEGETA
jgi:hypothetical protein